MKTLTKKQINNLAIYYNQRQTFDEITIVLLNTKQKSILSNHRYNYECLCASYTGDSFFQHSYCQRGKHLGKKIQFQELSKALQNRITNYFNN